MIKDRSHIKPTSEPAAVSANPTASLLERSGNPDYGAAGLASELKLAKYLTGKIPCSKLQGTFQLQDR